MSVERIKKLPAPKPARKKLRTIKVKGVSPVLNEPFIIDCLSVLLDPKVLGPLQSGAFLSIIDSHDRQILREQFIPIASAALGLHTAMGRLDTLASIRNVTSDPALTGHIDQAIKGLIKHADAKRIALSNMMNLVMQCPTAEDSIS